MLQAILLTFGILFIVLLLLFGLILLFIYTGGIIGKKCDEEGHNDWN